jgi:transcriptional regulator GlxA family with amidase domain
VSQGSIARGQENPSAVRPIAIVAFDGVELLDLTGPLDVFSMAGLGLQRTGIAAESPYPVEVLAKNPGLITCSSGLRIHAESAYGAVRDDIDTLLIPGSPDVNAVLRDPALRDWVRAMSTRVRRLVSICTGAFLLAEAGLLDGLRATTHWAYCDRLAADYPKVEVEPDRIFLRENSISTSGGITSGIDLALSLVEEDWGREIALNTARYMVVFLKRPGGQSQFSGFLISDATKDSDLRALQVWIMENPAGDLRVEALADRVSMSPRNFARVFQLETGITPAKFVEKARIDAARHLLGTRDDRIESVAILAGFGDAERMRRAFIRNLGINPHDYRARFGRSDEHLLPTLTNQREVALRESLRAS